MTGDGLSPEPTIASAGRAPMGRHAVEAPAERRRPGPFMRGAEAAESLNFLVNEGILNAE